VASRVGTLATTGTLAVGLRPGFRTWITGFGLPENDRDPADDPDADGTSNLEEYAFASDGNPPNPTSAPRPGVRVEGGQLQVCYLRARDDVSYSPETSAALGPDSWTTAGVQTTGGVVGEVVTAWVEMTPGTARQFLRVRVGIQ
jgi:hypothetical protein